MDAASEVTVQFRVVSAAQLPRTDLIGSIDPHVRIHYEGRFLGETRHVQNEQNPLWEEDLFFDVQLDEEGRPSGSVLLELYDENRARQDEYLGSVVVDLAELPPELFEPHGQQQIEFFDYPLTFKDDKRGDKLARQAAGWPQLCVALLGAMPSWSSLAGQLAGWEEELGLLADEESRQLYLPLPGGEGAGLYGGIHYQLPHAVHFKLVTVSKHHSGLHLDFRCSKARSLRVERSTHHQHRRRLMKGLRVYAEATLTNLPLSTDLRKLHLIATSRRAVASHSIGETLEAGGFPAEPFGSALSYKRVARDMAAASGKSLSGQGALLDEAASCVYLPVGGKGPHAAVLQLDFGSGGGGVGLAGLLGGGGGSAPRPVLRVLTLKGQEEGAQGRCVFQDFMTAGRETSTSVSEQHRRAVKLLDGQYEVVRAAELPGVFDDEDQGELYDSAVLVTYSLQAKPIASIRFTDLFQPPPEEEPPSDGLGSLLSVLEPLDSLPQSVGNVAMMVAEQGSKVVAQGGKVVGKVADTLGLLVDKVAVGGNTVVEGGTAAGSAVLQAVKAPLKIFRGTKERAADSRMEGSVGSSSHRSVRSREPRSSRRSRSKVIDDNVEEEDER